MVCMLCQISPHDSASPSHSPPKKIRRQADFLRLPASHNGAIAEVAARGELAATGQVTPVPESQTSTRLAVLPSSSFLPTASNAANKSEF
jgi:hypothetical protein